MNNFDYHKTVTKIEIKNLKMKNLIVFLIYIQ